MNGFVAFAYHLVGTRLERKPKQLAALQKKLLMAQIPLRAAAFQSALYLTALLCALPAALFGVALALVAPGAPEALVFLLPPLLALVVGGAVLVLGPAWLDNSIREREHEIDENLPHGLSYLLALANAGLPPRELWKSLADARVFGALATEAQRIARDLDLFGHDIVKALRSAQDRTASKRFHEFLQGAISAFQSGVELSDYLRSKAAQYQHEEVERQLKTMDTMGVMAETFLVMVVAAPLFMIIMLTVMAIDQGSAVLAWGFALSLVFIPLTQVIIGALVKSMNPKVWT